ncbi:cupin domain-containing protein [Denitratisoma sp. agr-D3]
MKPNRTSSASRHNEPLALLGGLSPKQFLAEYWQKKPLLIRNAVPGFTGLLSRDEMFAAARRDDVESRLVSREGGDWDLRRGPFAAKDLKPRKHPWTVLVQGLNLILPGAEALMQRFNFIPHARLDDVMVSWASDGGGVGPHFDNYDVFLLQGIGQRHWRIGANKDQTLVDGLPIRILKHFKPSKEWVLNPGDMLYLPPQYAHDGIAVGECMTYSVGFRTAPAQELAEGFLGFLQDKLCLAGRYADPGLKPAKHPGEITAEMVDQVADMLAKIRWDKGLVRDFLGEHLTEPKPHVFFDPPENPLSEARFVAAAVKKGLRLDARTQLLFAGKQFYLNGETVEGVEAADRSALQALADDRCLTAVDAALARQLYGWYCDGFIHLR